jgi:phosphohistidine swiveling domain-containing protein
VKLTNSIINPLTGLWRLDSAKLSTLKIRRSRIENSKLNDLEKIYWYIEDAKRYGTLPFAGLARAAFIAVQILKSLVTTNIFSKHDYEKFMGSISTISKDLINDKRLVPREDFLLKYGHLRPGTYDILSKSYDEDPNFYYNDVFMNFEESEEFTVTPSQESMINSMLESARMNINCSDLLAFIKDAVKLREYAKFEFTKNLSLALTLISSFGKTLGVQRSDLAFADYNVFKELYLSTDSQIDTLLQNIDIGKKRYQKTLKTFLPPLIVNPEDVFGFEWPTTLPNFVTQKQITSNVEVDFENCSVENRIVCIPNADPGYDWLFSHKISGLITAWGGANSHMAIRAGELGIPAVIGAGELLYKLWSNSKILHIDCANKKVEIVL